MQREVAIAREKVDSPGLAQRDPVRVTRALSGGAATGTNIER